MSAEIVEDEETGLRQVCVAARTGGPMWVGWNGTTYRWRGEGGPWETLYPDPDQTADAIALDLDARTDEAR